MGSKIGYRLVFIMFRICWHVVVQCLLARRVDDLYLKCQSLLFHAMFTGMVGGHLNFRIIDICNFYCVINCSVLQAAHVNAFASVYVWSF